MGALIVVLTAIARGARFSSTAQAPEVAASIEELEEQRSSLEWRGKLLAMSRDKTRAQLQDRRFELAHIEEHTRRLQAELAEVEAAEKALANRTGDKARDSLRQEVERLAAQVSRAEEDLVKSRVAAQARRPSYAVVPYTGPNGTERRPLYIECSGDRIILQPEQIELVADDFVGPMGPGNPLAAALRAQREYLTRHHNTNLGEDGEPYPLLLVRPDGIEAYYAAREAMSSWGSEFGYELVDQDWKLEFPPPNPALAALTRTAVAEARERQQLLALAAPRWAGEREWYRVTPRRGGGVVRDPGPGGDGDGGYGGENGPRRGGHAAGGSLAQGGGYGQHRYGGYGRGGNGRSERGGTGRGRTGYGSGTAGGTGGTGSGAAADDDDAALASVYGAAAGQSGIPDAVAGGGPGGSSTDPRLGTAGATGQRADHVLAAGGGDPAGTAAGQFAASPGGSAGQFSASPGGNAAGQFAAGPAAPAAGRLTAGPGGNSLRPGDAGASRNEGGAQTGSEGDSRQGYAGGEARGQAATGPAGARGASASPSGGGAGANATRGSPAASQMAANGAAGGSSASVQLGDPGAGAPGSVSTASVSLARSRGKDWSLPEEARHSVPITRPVRVECRADKLVLRPEQSGAQKTKEIPLAARTEDSVEELVGAVRDQVETWGPAGRGMYWQPTLSVQVAPGGAGRFADLQTLMADSGLDVRLVTPPTQAAPKRKSGLR
ncbi:MAG: hypothetical protein HYX69_08940 [Planctomycetia bacterium]|nr:hypothetical protein [Planctomycetia bacterium]